MREGPRFDRTLTCISATLLLAMAASAPLRSPARAAAPVAMQPDGTLQIAGRTVACGHVRNVLDPGLPNLGVASRRRNELVLNPERLGRYSGTVRLFVFHHECGHHHVGGDELEADCWAVSRGVRDGCLDRSHLASICRSFNRRESESHPAGEERCASLYQCFAAVTATSPRQARAPVSRDPSAFADRKPLRIAAASDPEPEPQPRPRAGRPPLPVATLLFVFVALVWAAAPKRRASRTAST